LISVQKEDFDVGQEIISLSSDSSSIGAVATFVGLVRDVNESEPISDLYLDHYPGMTVKSLEDIVCKARDRWPLQAVRVVHRVGLLSVGDQIVFVGVASKHRQTAFDACAYIMDYLKTDAPFWKKETTPDGSKWVDARESDKTALDRWQ